MVGWVFTTFRTPPPRLDPRWAGSWFAAVGAGWHWTEHLKTEIDFGAGNTARMYFSEPRSDYRNSPQPVHRSFSKKVIGVGQQYQFLHNAWFHPHVAVGANVTWERRVDEYQPFIFYDTGTAIPRSIDDRRPPSRATDVVVRPYVAGGFKAYLSRRAFFRSDLRVAFKKHAHEGMLRFGFGADF